MQSFWFKKKICQLVYPNIELKKFIFFYKQKDFDDDWSLITFEQIFKIYF